MFDFLKTKKTPPETEPVYLNQPHNSDVVASVSNTIVYATVYDENNRAVNVPIGDLQYWLRKGFKENPTDPEAVMQELLANLEAFKLAIEAFYKGCTDDKIIDRADGANLQAAVVAANLLTHSWDELLKSLFHTYPRSEGKSTLMVDDAGHEYNIDPAQVSLYKNSYGLKVK